MSFSNVSASNIIPNISTRVSGSVVNNRDILLLYRHLLKEGNKFHDYNFRSTAIRKTKQRFRSYKDITDKEEINKLYSSGVKELESLQRQIVVNNLYSHGKHIINVLHTQHK